jgi:hypothetical protein
VDLCLQALHTSPQLDNSIKQIMWFGSLSQLVNKTACSWSYTAFPLLTSPTI